MGKVLSALCQLLATASLQLLQYSVHAKFDKFAWFTNAWAKAKENVELQYLVWYDHI